MNMVSGRIALLGVIGCVAGCDGLPFMSNTPRPASEQQATGAVAMGQESDLSSLDEEIAAARQYSDPEGVHLDPAPLIQLLEEHQGDLDTLSYICERFYWPSFCWRQASQLNPDLREELCERYVEGIAEMHDDCVADEQSLVDHESECLLGIPIFIY
ncbi:MAG: hypothetical protein JSV19_13235 [Phycisphaerales bacterium]|nr:MAG: hypothetical protein JSV19_13235 [Phycisphaerales bacterium]